MPKIKRISCALSVALLAGCASSPQTISDTNPELLKQIEKIQLNVPFSYVGGEPVLGSYLIPASQSHDNFTSRNEFVIDGQTLFPSSDTSRTSCTVNTDICDTMEAIASESPFLNINNYSRSYGDTYSERIEAGQDPGLSGLEMAAWTIGAPAYAAGLVVGTVIFSPILAFTGAYNLATEGTIILEKDVEFNHDKFFATAVELIMSEYGDMTNYTNYMAETSVLYNEVLSNRSSIINSIRQEEQSLKRELTSFRLSQRSVHDYCDIRIPLHGDIDSVSKNVRTENSRCQTENTQSYIAALRAEVGQARTAFAKEQRLKFERAATIDELTDFIRYYRNSDVSGLVNEAVSQRNSLISARQHEEFDSIRTDNELTAFINTYTNHDPANLVPRARAMQEERLRARREQINAQLTSFRESLSVGDNTFCGRVIQKRGSNMFEISLTARLQGYPSTIWLHSDEIFMPHSGCVNRNGNVSPRSNPFAS